MAANVLNANMFERKKYPDALVLLQVCLLYRRYDILLDVTTCDWKAEYRQASGSC
jgi:hypothetical protein